MNLENVEMTDGVRFYAEVMRHRRRRAPTGERAVPQARSAIVGSVEDCIQGIEQLQEETGGFGTLLVYVQDWADWEKTKRSYDLLARYVAPHFTGSVRRMNQSAEWFKTNRDLFPQLKL